jgi:hypothetical protein
VAPDPEFFTGDVESLKNEVDSLVARIRLSAGNSSPPGRSPPVTRPVELERELPPRHRKPPADDPVRIPAGFHSQPKPILDEEPRDLGALRDSGNMPTMLRLQQENAKLKAELLKTQRSLQAEKDENQKLAISLEKSEQLRSEYKRRLAELQQVK